ncbi:MAG: hypothetical protein AUH71_03135 [Thaumarchaeota archaeon 13_1_40CM_4_48_7]|nr:MAG: hypothetical protein AUH71_03135 [Thaumarchaeota archaeon 13_1_40CM_4_48_7]
MIYGLIEHMLLASPIGISVLTYPMSIHIAGQLYFYHVVMLLMAILVSFNPFFDRLIFRMNRSIKLQGVLWGSGNILNFIWLEDLFYFVLFGEWPKDVMTPLHISVYGIVWWYPIAFGGALFLYYHTSKIIKRTPLEARKFEDGIS